MLMCLSSLGGFLADALECVYIKMCCMNLHQKENSKLLVMKMSNKHDCEVYNDDDDIDDIDNNHPYDNDDLEDHGFYDNYHSGHKRFVHNEKVKVKSRIVFFFNIPLIAIGKSISIEMEA